MLYGQHFQRSMDQKGMFANPARGQLNRENGFSLSSFAPENLFLPRRFCRPVPRQPAHSPLGLMNLGLTHRIPSAFRDGVHYAVNRYNIGSIPRLSGRANAYRWRSLPRVCRPSVSSPQGSSSNGCCFFGQASTWTNFCAPLFFHAYHWYVVDM